MANWLDCLYGPTIGVHYHWHRWVTGKYGPATPEKTGIVPDRFSSAVTRVMGQADPHYEPPCLWVHGVSVGEIVASRGIAKMFMADNHLWELRVSTTTATGRKVANDAYGDEQVFYYPIDFSWMVRRAFKRVRPDLIVLMELEIWPNFLAEALARKVPVVVANARITERSVKRLKLVPRLVERMAGAISRWFPQSDAYAERLESIGVPRERIEVLGSVKYDAVPEELDTRDAAAYRRLFEREAESTRPLVVAGSTHPGEEKAVLDAIRGAAENGAPSARIVIAPRHPERVQEVVALARNYGTVALRSRLADEPMPADIVVADVMGELAKIYSAADLVFVGGTLTNRGGQNFMEPCGLAKPTIVGPNLWNFAEPAELLREGRALRVVADAAELARAFREYLSSPEEANRMGALARELLLDKRGASRRIVDRLNVMAGEVMAGCRGRGRRDAHGGYAQ